jgi:hypothetical protein
LTKEERMMEEEVSAEEKKRAEGQGRTPLKKGRSTDGEQQGNKAKP